jgi:hypothetical protein
MKHPRFLIISSKYFHQGLIQKRKYIKHVSIFFCRYLKKEKKYFCFVQRGLLKLRTLQAVKNELIAGLIDSLDHLYMYHMFSLPCKKL